MLSMCCTYQGHVPNAQVGPIFMGTWLGVLSRWCLTRHSPFHCSLALFPLLRTLRAAATEFRTLLETRRQYNVLSAHRAERAKYHRHTVPHAHSTADTQYRRHTVPQAHSTADTQYWVLLHRSLRASTTG